MKKEGQFTPTVMKETVPLPKEISGNKVDFNSILEQKIRLLKKHNLELLKKIETQTDKKENTIEENLTLDKEKLKKIEKELLTITEEKRRDLLSHENTLYNLQKEKEENKRLDGLICTLQEETREITQRIRRQINLEYEEELFSTYRKLISLISIFDTFLETETPLYINCLSTIYYVKDEIKRYLLTKEVSEIPINFLDLSLETKINNRQSVSDKVLKKGFFFKKRVLITPEIEISKETDFYNNKIKKGASSINDYRRRVILAAEESFLVEKTIRVNIIEYIESLQSKYHISFPSFFNEYYLRKLSIAIDQEPLNSKQRINEEKTKLQIFEDCCQIISRVPELDPLKKTNYDDETMKKIVMKVEEEFLKWKENYSEEIQFVNEDHLMIKDVKKYLQNNEILSIIRQNPSLYKECFSDEEKEKNIVLIKRINYFRKNIRSSYRNSIKALQKDLGEEEFSKKLEESLLSQKLSSPYQELFVNEEELKEKVEELALLEEDELKKAILSLIFLNQDLQLNEIKNLTKEYLLLREKLNNPEKKKEIIKNFLIKIKQ